MFNKIFSKTASGRNVRPDVRTEVPLEQQLTNAQKALQKLSNAPPGDSEAFPLLNESTRMVQQLEGLVARLPHDDMREIWRAQLDELQTELKSLTERVLNSYTGGAPRSGSQSSPAPVTAPKPPRKPSPTPSNRSFSASPRANPAARPAASTPTADVSEDVALFDDMDLFSGLSLAEGMDPPTHVPATVPQSTPTPSATPSATTAAASTAAAPKPSETQSRPLASSTPPPQPSSAPRATPGSVAVSTPSVRDHAGPPSPTSTHPGSPAYSTTSTFSSIAPSITTSSLANPGSPRQTLQTTGSGIRAPLDENWFTSLADPEPEDELDASKPAAVPAETKEAPTTAPVDTNAADTTPSRSDDVSHAPPVSSPSSSLKTPVPDPLAAARTAAAPVAKSSASAKKSKKKTQKVRVGYAEEGDDDDEPPLDLGLGSRSTSAGLEAGVSSSQTGVSIDELAASLASSLSLPKESEALAASVSTHVDDSGTAVDPGDGLEFEGLSIANEEDAETAKADRQAEPSDEDHADEPSATSIDHDVAALPHTDTLRGGEPTSTQPVEEAPNPEDAVTSIVARSVPGATDVEHKAASVSDAEPVVSAGQGNTEEQYAETSHREEGVSISKSKDELTELQQEEQQIEAPTTEKEGVTTITDAQQDDLPDAGAVDTFFSGLQGESSSRAAAAQLQVENWIAAAAAAAQQKQTMEQEVNKKRRETMAELAKVSNRIKELEEEQSVAVEAEDFERADVLNTDLEALTMEQQGLQERVKDLDEEAGALSSARIQLVSHQAELYSKLSDFLAALCEERRSEASQVLAEAEQHKSEADGAREAAEGRVDVMQSRISAKHKVLEEEQATLDEKIAIATKPAMEEKQVLQEEHDKLRAEVEELERQLAAKRAELEASTARIEEVDTKVKALASKFDKRATDIAAERAQLASEEAALEQETEALAALQEDAVSKQQEYDAMHKKLLEEAEVLLAAGNKAKTDAESIRAQISDEAGAKQQQSELRAASLEAQDKLQELVKCVEEIKTQVSGLTAQCTYLTGEKAAAEEKVAEAHRRIPEIEADKKAAAAKKDFKEAARLSAEAKAVAAQAEKLAAEAKQSAAQLEKLELEQATLTAQLEELEGMLAEAERDAAVARWHCLQFNIKHNRKRLEAAVENELYDEADSLQADIDADASEAEALSSRWNLSADDSCVEGSTSAEQPPEETVEEPTT